MAAVDSHIPYRSRVLGAKIALLMERYAKNQHFKRRATELRECHLQLRRYHWGRIETYTSFNPRGRKNTEVETIKAASKCKREVIDLAEDFGLCCDWGPAAVWNYLRQERARGPEIGFVEPMPFKYTVHVTYYPDTSLKELQRQITAKLREDWPRIEEELKAQPGYVRRKRFPKQVHKHVQWLYQRIALGMTAKEIYTEELDKSDKRMETIQQAIKALARELGIQIPRGRPRKK